MPFGWGDDVSSGMSMRISIKQTLQNAWKSIPGFYGISKAEVDENSGLIPICLRTLQLTTKSSHDSWLSELQYNRVLLTALNRHWILKFFISFYFRWSIDGYQNCMWIIDCYIKNKSILIIGRISDSCGI